MELDEADFDDEDEELLEELDDLIWPNLDRSHSSVTELAPKPSAKASHD